MSTAPVTLDSIRAAAEAKYGSYDIDGVPAPTASGDVTVRLLNPLRLSKTDRDALVGLQAELEAEDADQEALLAKAIRITAQDDFQADALLAAIGDDLAVLASVFEGYSKGTQAGEASASAA